MPRSLQKTAYIDSRGILAHFSLIFCCHRGRSLDQLFETDLSGKRILARPADDVLTTFFSKLRHLHQLTPECAEIASSKHARRH